MFGRGAASRREMTRRMVAGAEFAQWRNFGLAARLGDGTTRVKGTTARRMNGRGQLAGEENAPAPGIRIDDRHGGNESLCVWMFGEMANRFGVARLDDPAKIHDEDPPADVFDDGDVVRVEQDLARGGFDQPDDRPAQGGLAAAAFADETNGFAWRNGQADIVHGPHDVLAPAEYAVRHGEMDFEIANFEQIHAGTSDSEPQ